MAKTEHYYVKFEPNLFYHVYNRAVDKKPLFRSDENRRFFLKRFEKYLSPVLITYSYALCGNHFHFGVKIRSAAELENFRKAANLSRRFLSPHELVSHQFRRFFQSYAMAFNKQHGRYGTLFQTPFKRCLVDTERKLIRMIFYHHANPQLHGLCNDFQKFRWTSYIEYTMHTASKLPKTDVFNLFGGKMQFIAQHRLMKTEIYSNTNELVAQV